MRGRGWRGLDLAAVKLSKLGEYDCLWNFGTGVNDIEGDYRVAY